MLLQALFTSLLGALVFWWGIRLGRILLRQGATANDLFKGHTSLSLLFLGLYIGLVVLALNVPQMQIFPLEWRVYGMQITWTVLRVLLLGFCGLAFIVSWRTARSHIIAVLLIGILGISAFTAAEAYFLAPIYPELQNDLRADGVFKQTSMSSCAPAAMATLLRLWKIDATESSVARLAGTSRMGTSMPQLLVAAHQLGMDGLELEPSWEQMKLINRPGILGVWLFDGPRKLPHAVALLGIRNEVAAIADPARGRIVYLDRSQFDLIWRHQYLPLFRMGETTLTPNQTQEYLSRWGYLTSTLGNLSAGIRQFQQAIGLRVTGELDPLTALFLSGLFLDGVPTLSS